MRERDVLHMTPSRRRAGELKAEAEWFEREARILSRVPKMEPAVKVRMQTAGDYRARAALLELKARLEDLSVRRAPVVKQTASGRKTYWRWLASWREGSKIRTVYLGSCNRLSEDQALEKARRMKAKALGIEM